MKDRIIKFLQDENLTSTRFADEIGVQRSSISHIISGRNKPSFDFIHKILSRYPEINADWLILGKGSMYKSDQTATEPPKTAKLTQKTIFDAISSSESKYVANMGLSEKSQDITNEIKNKTQQNTSIHSDTKPEQKLNQSEIQIEKLEPKENSIEKPLSNNKSIERIVVFFNDNSFKEYLPEK